MAITDKTQGVWTIDQAYNKNTQGSIWPLISENILYSWGQQADDFLLYDAPSGAAKSSPTQVGDATDTGWQAGKFAYHYEGGKPYEIGIHAIKTDGTLWCWGHNENGWFGDNTGGTNSNSPKQIPGTWTHISNGISVAGIKDDGSLWTWGDNTSDEAGNLGLNDTVMRSSPTQVPGTYKSVAAFREMAMCAVKTDGTLWGWGRQYRWGNTSISTYISSPTQVGTNTNWSDVALPSAGNGCFSGLKTDGSLWVWGNGSATKGGQNGGTPQWYTSPRQVGTDTDWARPTVDKGANWLWKGDSKQLWLLGGESYALKTPGALYPGPAAPGGVSSPIQLDSQWNGGVVSGSADGNNMQIVRTDGTMWIWGQADKGYFCDKISPGNDGTEISSPIQIPGTNWQAPLISGAVPYGSMMAMRTDTSTTSGV